MKRLLLLLIIAAFASCGNKKARLVDMQKIYADSASNYQRFTEREMAKNLDNPNLTILQRLKINKDNEEKAVRCTHIVDSLEWELKKY